MMCEGKGEALCVITGAFQWGWVEGKIMGTWELADAVQLDKHNRKEGTKAIRLINKLDPAGKLYFDQIHIFVLEQ